MIFQSRLLINRGPHSGYRSFESLTLRLSHSNWKVVKAVLLVTVYLPPGRYSEFLSEFLSTDKIIIMGDFNIHVDM